MLGALAGCRAILGLLDAGPKVLVAYRPVYALLEQTRVPHMVTGATVGLVSMIGYTLGNVLSAFKRSDYGRRNRLT